MTTIDDKFLPWMKEEEWAKAWCPLPKQPTPDNKPVTIEIASLNVTEEDKKQFWEQGYWVGPKVISDDDLERLRKEMQRVFSGQVDNNASPYEYGYWLKGVKAQRSGSPQVRKINNAWWINETIRTVVTSEEIGKAAAYLLDTEEIRLWHDQAILKPPTTGDDKLIGNIGWHQDYGFWQASNSTKMCTAWIPLQDVDESNGALRTITRSHKWGLKEDSATFFDKDMEHLKSKFAGDDWEDKPCLMKAGQIAIHHCLTFHGSGPNLSQAPRWAIAVHMHGKGCGYSPGHGWHHNVQDLGPNAKAGDLFVGPRFPLLYGK